MNDYLIGVGGHKNSGKDTVAKMITFIFKKGLAFANYTDYKLADEKVSIGKDKIFHFADTLKDVISILYDINISYLNDRKYKDNMIYCLNDKKFVELVFENKQVKYITLEDLKEQSLAEIMSDTTKKYYIKIRTLMQYVGTDVCRKYLNDNIWIDSTIGKAMRCARLNKCAVIADVRFANEVDKIKRVNLIDNRHNADTELLKPRHIASLYGEVIVVKRNLNQTDENDTHSSETIDYKADYIIDNNGSELSLFYKVSELIRQIINKHNNYD